MTFEDEVKTAVVVAEASTKAMTRSILVATIPIIELTWDDWAKARKKKK